MAKTIANPKKIQSKSRQHQVKHLGGNSFEVVSGTSGNAYRVTLVPGGARCACKWGHYRPGYGKSGCSHVVAVYDWLEARRGRSVSAWTDPDDARRQHRPVLGIGDNVLLTSRKVAA
jgi:hypothetical protein